MINSCHRNRKTYLRVNEWRRVSVVIEAPESVEMARSAKEVEVEGVAPFVGLVCQLHPAVLTLVAVHVVVLVHRYHSNRLLRSLATAIINNNCILIP